jgi:hypothetical protein
MFFHVMSTTLPSLMNKVRPFFLAALLAFGALAGPVWAEEEAKTLEEVTVEATPLADEGGLVPCGTSARPEACTLCHLAIGVNGVVQWGMKVMTYIALAVITAMGILYIMSAGDGDMTKTAKKGIKAALAGFALMLGAWLIVNVIISSLAPKIGVSKGSNWYTFTCDRSSRTGAGLYSGQNADVSTSGTLGELTCSSGKCSAIASQVKANQYLDPNLVMTILDGGEGCSPKNSSDGRGSCGYGQVLPENRVRYCQMTGTASDCEAFKADIQKDINCAAKFMSESLKKCLPLNPAKISTDKATVLGTPGSAGYIGACYNCGPGKKGSGPGKSGNCCGTHDYCVRTQKYYNSCN